MIAKHAPTDPAKLASLIDAMRRDGWTEAIPAVIAIGDEAITGSHRIAAAKETDTPIRAVDLIEEAVDIEATGWTVEELLTVADDDDIADMLRQSGRPDILDRAC